MIECVCVCIYIGVWISDAREVKQTPEPECFGTCIPSAPPQYFGACFKDEDCQNSCLESCHYKICIYNQCTCLEC